MDCLEAREGLWPPERPRLAEDEVLAARRHVEGCLDCRDYFTQDRVLLEAYDRARGARAPRSVRERVFDVLARERAGRVGRAQGGLVGTGFLSRHRGVKVAAFLAVLGAGAVVWLGQQESPRQVAEGGVFVEDYLRRAVAEDRIVTSDPGEVARFLERELGIFNPPLLADGFRLASAEICLLEGRRGAMVRYEGEAGAVSHYLVPRAGSTARAPSNSGRVEAEDQSSPAVITWATPSLEQALVGSLSHERLLKIARGATSM